MINVADCVKETTTANSAASIPLGGEVAGSQSFAEAFTVGMTNIPVRMADSAGNWENGYHTLTAAGLLTRTAIHSSSNGGAAVTFPAGEKEVFCTLTASALADYLASVELSSLTVITPTDALALPIVNRTTGATNLILISALRTLFGGTAPAADTTAPVFAGGAALASSNVTAAGFTLTGPAATDAVGVARYEYSLDGGTTWTNNNLNLSVIITGRTASTTYPTRWRAVDAAGNASAALSLSVTTAAPSSDTTAPSMSGSIAVSAITSSGYTYSYGAGSDNVAVDHYDTSENGGANWASNGLNLSRVVTGRPAATTDDLRVRAVDAAGLMSNVLTGAATTSAAAPASDFVSREMVSVSGGTYTGMNTGASVSAGIPSGGVIGKAFQPGQDGSFSVRVANVTAAGTGANEIVIGCGPEDFAMRHGNIAAGAIVRTTGYIPYENGAGKTALNSVPAAIGDVIKWERVGSTLTMYVSKDGGATFPSNLRIYQFTVSTGQLFGQVYFANQAAIENIQTVGLGAPAKIPVSFGSLVGVTEGGSAGARTYAGNGTVAAFSVGQSAIADKLYDGSKNGSITMPLISLGTGRAALFSSASAAAVVPASAHIGGTNDTTQWSSYYQGATSTPVNVLTPASGDLLRVTRMGIAHRVSVSKDGGESYALVKEFATGNSTSNNFQLFLTGTTSIGPVVGTGLV